MVFPIMPDWVTAGAEAIFIQPCAGSGKDIENIIRAVAELTKSLDVSPEVAELAKSLEVYPVVAELAKSLEVSPVVAELAKSLEVY